MSDITSTLQARLTAGMPVVNAVKRKLAEIGAERVQHTVTLIVYVLAIAYFCSIIVSSFLMNMMMQNITAARARFVAHGDEGTLEILPHAEVTNFRDLQKVIKERNIFNSEGKFPDEKFGLDKHAASASFDIDAPCRPTAINIELLGTIYLGNRLKSLATVKDKGYSEADVYRVGDAIIGNEGASIAAVERQRLIINNNGVKECIELEKPLPGQANDGFPTDFGGNVAGVPTGGAGGGTEIQLESAYVESELGPGFAKIVDAARFVPNTTEGGVNGFKIFAIKAGSLLSKIGLQNNDVVTQVNSTSLTNVEQGFAMYQALQDEKEVRLQILRGGSTPMNITVRIK